jgi:glycosyltransferase involved in cell wall biosynthesis
MARHLSRHADVHVVSGGYSDLGPADLPGLQADQITTCLFTRPGEIARRDAVSFPVVGMSDVMPYPSATWGELTDEQLDEYLERFASALTLAVTRFDPTVIHVNHAWFLASLVRFLFPSIPVVISAHGTDGKQFRAHPRLREYVRPWIASAHGVFAISEESRTQLQEEYVLSPDRIHMGGYGFDPEVFTPFAETGRYSVLEALGVPPEARHAPLILAIGKFVSWKGFEELIAAVRMVADQTGPVTCVIIGEGSESSRRQLEETIRRLGLGQMCFLPGSRPQPVVAGALRAADVFVLPSYDEPWGLVLMEALACGVPVVFANRGAPAEYVSRTLIDRGLAQPVDPIRLRDDGEPYDRDERERYVSRIRTGLRSILEVGVTNVERRTIAESVGHLCWESLSRQALAVYAALKSSEDI